MVKKKKMGRNAVLRVLACDGWMDGGWMNEVNGNSAE